MDPMNDPSSRCPRCGAANHRQGAEDGTCPACLLAAAGLWASAPPPDAGEPEISGECGGYVLERLIGRGGSGVVYQARRPSGGPAVALKTLATAHAAGPDELRRFRFEMESGAALEHPNLVRVLEVGEDSGVPFYVMDLAAGGTLADHIPETPHKDGVKPATAILTKVARAVHFAHERGVLHRDLKPANILLDQDGEPRVADFGMGRLLHSPAALTLTGAAIGTPAYMAPEQASGGTVTTAADQYSLGAVLYHLLTGSPPFTGNGPMEILHKVVSAEVPDPSSLAPWIDRDLATICLTALRRDPSRRYASVAEFADDLERWQLGKPVVARPLPAWRRATKWARRHPVAATLTITGALAAAALASMYVAGSEMLKTERNRALKHEAEARSSAAEATAARDQFQLNAYAADVYLGFRALADGHFGQAREMLARHQPRPDSKDLRGFEWHALDHLCQGDDQAVWRDHSAAVTAVGFHPRTSLLASGGRDGKIIVREFPSGTVRLCLPLPSAPRDFAEIPYLTSVAKRSADFAALTVSGAANPDDLRMRSRPSKLGEIHALAWSPDGKWLASGGGGSFVRIWSMPGGSLSGVIPVMMASRLAFSDDGSRLIVFAPTEGENHRHELRVYDTETLATQHVIRGLQEVHAIAPGGGRAAVMPSGGTEIRIHDIRTGDILSKWDGRISLKRLAFGSDGSFLIGGEASGVLAAVWRTTDGQRTGSVFPVAGKFDLLQVQPPGLRLISTGAGQMISAQAIAADSPAVSLRGHEDTVLSLDVSPDGKWLLSGGNDHTVRLWPTSKPLPQANDDGRFKERPEPPAEVRENPSKSNIVWTWTSEGHWIGDGARNGRIRFRPFSNNSAGRRITAPPERYGRLVSAPDGTLAAMSWPRSVRLMRPNGDRWEPPWTLTQGTLGPIVFSPDSRLLASGGDDNLIGIRDTATGRLVAELRGHQGTIADIAFSPDGRTLASSAADRTLRLWHVPTWRELGILHQGEVLANLEFSMSGDALRGRTGTGEIRVFHTTGK